MLTVSMYYPGDREQVVKQAAWIAELGGCKNHELLVVRDKRAEPVPELNAQFGKVHKEIVVTDPYNKWPDSCSLMFTTVARHIEYLIKKPWLMLEPDAVPLKVGWLDILEQEYLRAKRPFMGAFVPGIHGAPDHMSGVGIYPPNICDYAGQLYFAGETPWDLVAASQVLANAHTTDLIQHKWDRSFSTPIPQPTGEGFNSYEEFRNNVTTECVLFHADKGWRIPDLIRPLLFPPNGKPDSSGKKVERDQCFVPLSEPKEGTRNNGFIWQNGAWRAESFPGLADVPATIPNESYLKPLAGLGTSQMGVEHNVPPAVKASKVKDSLPSGRNERAGSATALVAGTQNFTMNDVKRSAELLGVYAKQNGFALMRVRKELKAAGLLPKGKHDLRNNDQTNRTIAARRTKKRVSKRKRNRSVQATS